ncbi:MAG: iron-containing alcohol dehydrogenase [Chloroflexi bacterium]|nr:iron-containing alcohol dehydrogenase [Chloroflexota bacterium]
MQGAEFCRAEKCDLIIAIGGGSPMDCAKSIGIVSSNEKHILEFEGVDQVAIPGLPLICIPTTAGSSADVSQFAIITDTTRRVKIAIISKTLVPDVALIDPQTTTTMSPALTAATGVDALVHGFEAYVSNASSPLTDLYALEAIRLVTCHLANAVHQPHDAFARNQMMLGSLMAGLAFSNASLGLVHSMSHSLGGLLDLAHGDSNAILLEPVVAFNFHATRERYVRIGEAMGLTLRGLDAEEQKYALQRTLADLRHRVGIRQTLGELGVTQRDLPHLASAAHRDPCLATNPVQPTVAEIEKLYEQVL